MTKYEFLDELRQRLAGVPSREKEESIAYYSEMIEDRIEDGADEHEAVAAVGTPEQAAEQILRDVPITKLVKERVKPKRRLRAWEIVLLILGSPIWLPILIALAAVFLAVYIALWSVVISLYAVMAACFACGAVALMYSVWYVIPGGIGARLCMLGAGLALVGLGIFLLLGSNACAKGLVWLLRKLFLGIKKSLARKEKSA